MLRHYLQALLAPHSAALVGATEREGALGNIVYRNLAAGSLRALYPVNPKHRTVHGARCYPRLSALPAGVELAVVATPAATVPQVIDEAGRAGIRAAVVLTSGFGEAGPAGITLQEEMLRNARKHGVRIMGPNCLGLMRS